MASRTITQRSNADGFPKAGELIEMTGLEDLEASQRAISNLLYQHAHDSGRITEPGDRLRASLVALARIVASVCYVEQEKDGKGSYVMACGSGLSQASR